MSEGELQSQNNLPALEVKNISKRFSHVQALDDSISFFFKPFHHHWNKTLITC